ncbi:MAG: tetratricopeptide repeat protein [Treponema sp.]|uniref:tetratricopeptide repeat protein n=1 Tax=Treponema sp. TaxID=166 RepID=UPI001C16B5D3|nr:tetratricopeptide repeat protein [Treponema sp.]MBQ8680120.1 tetratricopeptide repeat protein [Treponema sp.]MBR1535715.1 tetratricopeptide repeat protein [Treponema sp.]
MIVFAVILILVVLIGFLGVFVIKSLAAPKKIDSINRLIKQQKYSAAQKIAKSLIAKDPRDYHAHYYLGKAYLADRKNELALMEFKTVANNALFDAQLPEAEFRKQLSQLYLKFNQLDDALKEFLLLTKLEPTNAENFYNCGKIYEQQNNAENALGFYQKAIKFNKKHIKAWSGMGMILFRAKQFGEAKKAIDYALKLSPETFSTYYFLGKILKESKDYSGAVKAFEKACRDPEYKQRAMLERGSCYMMAGAIDNAQLEFEKAIKASKDEKSQETLYARYFLASCFEKNRKIDKAIEQWQLITKVNHSFRDVPTKLSEYKDLQSNDSLKEFLTSSNSDFVEICKKASLAGFNMNAQTAEETKWGCQIIATEAKKDDWMNMRKQLFLLNFYRVTDPLEDAEVRRTLDFAKSKNCVKAYACTSSEFTTSAIRFAENRPIELVSKEKLESILAKAGI